VKSQRVKPQPVILSKLPRVILLAVFSYLL